MNRSRYTGRIAVLAVAMGIGAAFAAYPSAASADEDTGGASHVSASTAKTGPSDDSGPAEATHGKPTPAAAAADHGTQAKGSETKSAAGNPSTHAATVGGSGDPSTPDESAGPPKPEHGTTTDPAPQQPATSGEADSGPTGRASAVSPTAAPRTGSVDRAAQGSAVRKPAPGNDVGAANVAQRKSLRASASDDIGGPPRPTPSDDPGTQRPDPTTTVAVLKLAPTIATTATAQPTATTVTTQTATSEAPTPADPIAALVAIPARIFAAVVNVVISAVEPFVAPGGPFENAALFGALAFTRREVDNLLVSTDSAPVAFGDRYTTQPGQTLDTSAVDGVLRNDIDFDHDPLTAVQVTGPEHGTLAFDADGSFAYRPDDGFAGEDSFSYATSDGLRTSPSPAIVSITVSGTTPSNTAPVANNDPDYSTPVGQQLVVTAADGVLANDSDADGDSLTALLADRPTKGIVTLDRSGSFIYTPISYATGTDSFTYQANDGRALSTPATVIVTLISPDQAESA